jgi:putative transposon-encoded protein
LVQHQLLEFAMVTTVCSQAVKLIGTNGQISLGKQYAGRQVLVEEREPGVWLVRTATIVPDNERWLQEPQAAAELQTALAWSTVNPASDTDTEDTLKRLNHGEQ